MGIDRSPFVMAGPDELVVEIEPVPGGKVAHPPVAAAAMVEDHVHDYLHSASVRVIDESDVLLHRTETRVDVVVVRDGVAVVGIGAVLLHGVEPDSRHAEVLDVVHVLHHALDVAAVAPAVTRAVGPGALQRVVGGIAVGEAVGGDQVQNVLRTESLRARFAVARAEFEGLDGLAAGSGEGDVHRARPGIVGDVEIEEQVIGVGGLHDVLEGYAPVVDTYLLGGDVRSVDHHLQGVVLHPHPPERRIHVLDLSRKDADALDPKESKAAGDRQYDLFHSTFIFICLNQGHILRGRASPRAR